MKKVILAISLFAGGISSAAPAAAQTINVAKEPKLPAKAQASLEDYMLFMYDAGLDLQVESIERLKHGQYKINLSATSLTNENYLTGYMIIKANGEIIEYAEWEE